MKINDGDDARTRRRKAQQQLRDFVADLDGMPLDEDYSSDSTFASSSMSDHRLSATSCFVLASKAG